MGGKTWTKFIDNDYELWTIKLRAWKVYFRIEPGIFSSHAKCKILLLIIAISHCAEKKEQHNKQTGWLGRIGASWYCCCCCCVPNKTKHETDRKNKHTAIKWVLWDALNHLSSMLERKGFAMKRGKLKKTSLYCLAPHKSVYDSRRCTETPISHGMHDDSMRCAMCVLCVCVKRVTKKYRKIQPVY